jgi:hypothetical protein
VSEAFKESTTRNFSLRLTPDDHTRLEQIAVRFALDRTGVLRLLIRRAAVGLIGEGCFTTVGRGRARQHVVRLKHERKTYASE